MERTYEELIEEVVNNFTAFPTNRCCRENLLEEELKLQQEVSELAKIHFKKPRDTIWDTFNELERENQEKGGIATRELEELKPSCRDLNNLIRARISGDWGENQVFSRLTLLKGKHRTLRNVVLACGDTRTECDLVVLTEKAQFIIEVKNTKKNVFFDEEGNYYRNSEYMNYDCNLLEKMDFRGQLLENVISTKLAKMGKSANIVKLVVFTNRQIEICNKCEGLRTCFLGALPYIIDEYNGAGLYSEEDIEELADVINNVCGSLEIEVDMDVQKFKWDFAKVLVRLENADEFSEEIVEPQEDQPTEKVLKIPEYLTANEQEHESGSSKWLPSVAALVVIFCAGLVTGHMVGLYK